MIPTFAEYLGHSGYPDATRIAYQSIALAAGKAPSDASVWLTAGIRGAHFPGSTPLRQAARRYLRDELGLDRSVITTLLPEVSGKITGGWSPLTRAQLQTYYLALDSLPVGPAWAILHLIPRTGLHVAEACSLPADTEIRGVLRVPTEQGKTRRIILSKGARTVLRTYRASLAATPRPSQDAWLFPGYKGRAIGAPAVRKVLRELCTAHPELGALTPTTLWHTYATYSLRTLVNLPALHAVLGSRP